MQMSILTFVFLYDVISRYAFKFQKLRRTKKTGALTKKKSMRSNNEFLNSIILQKARNSVNGN